ncbi:hypothetical protein QQY24_15365 [Streptomyces sp. TG1A-8]|uniref:hypothetical protein n=1 Tax=Streptomyces sp. TG1A-8 TaxID=3051385 RepID=UPI00265BD959|nr:hypothetical protein [Streptomyces sp. TG1A-8]MDO0926728.1 hypothetical protein [Streptomyces sp. TG1A-8]
MPLSETREETGRIRAPAALPAELPGGRSRGALESGDEAEANQGRAGTRREECSHDACGTRSRRHARAARHVRGRHPGASPGHRTPDILDARGHRIARVALSVVLGVAYGFWAATNRRFGGPLTLWNFLFGLLTGVVFAVLLMAVLTLAPRLRWELHALLWGVFAGCSVGFLYSQSNVSSLQATGVGLAVAAGTTLTFFYRLYKHQRVAGRPGG